MVRIGVAFPSLVLPLNMASVEMLKMCLVEFFLPAFPTSC
jgi:hypothetical protein